MKKTRILLCLLLACAALQPAPAAMAGEAEDESRCITSTSPSLAQYKLTGEVEVQQMEERGRSIIAAI